MYSLLHFEPTNCHIQAVIEENISYCKIFENLGFKNITIFKEKIFYLWNDAVLSLIVFFFILKFENYSGSIPKPFFYGWKRIHFQTHYVSVLYIFHMVLGFYVSVTYSYTILYMFWLHAHEWILTFWVEGITTVVVSVVKAVLVLRVTQVMENI